MGGTGAAMNERISDELAWLMFACATAQGGFSADQVPRLADEHLAKFRERFPLPPLNPRLGGDFGPKRRNVDRGESRGSR